MELVPTEQEGNHTKTAWRLPSWLTVYLTTIYALGLIAVVFVVVSTEWSLVFDNLLVAPTVFLAVAAIAGEIKPIPLVRGGAEPRTLSTSAPFVLALMAVGGVGAAVVVQVAASIADDVIRRRPIAKSSFNSAQYALSVFAAGVVYSALADVPLLGPPMPVEPHDIWALLGAGIMMIGVNWLLVGGVVSVSVRESLTSVLRSDVRDFLVTLVVLLSIGGIAALVASDGVRPLVLLAVPVVAAHIFAASVARHAHEAAHDPLTGLGNRGLADYELQRVLDQVGNPVGQGPGLVLLDLDHFKDFNDALGHPVGDKILRKVAQRLVEASPEGASVHRLGGDEFAVVVEDGLENSIQVAHALLGSLDAPIEVENLDLLVRFSAGVAVAPMHGSDSETLMKNADIALYHAKRERDRISTYSPDFDVNSVERLKLLADLRAALDAGQLEVAYQPQVNLQDRRTVGVEALVRWNHPERGMIAPDEFIPLAENSGLIFPLTELVLDAALGELARWRAKGHYLRLAVNLSARHLSDLALPGQVAQAAARHGVPPGTLVLEVTETGILSDPVRADVVIGALRRLGVAIAIDDYGTGNASLGYLKRLEVDELKIDRSYVSNIAADHYDLIIVRSTISLALALGLRVVAEGVEDELTAGALGDLGRVVGQGYHLGRPVPPEQIMIRLDEERRTSVRAKTESD